MPGSASALSSYEVLIPAGARRLTGIFAIPRSAEAIVVFAQGSSTHLNMRQPAFAEELQQAGMATLLFDMLTEQEDRNYETHFDIELLTARLLAATAWLRAQEQTQEFPLAYMGAGTGAAAALSAAAQLPEEVRAVVIRGGRPELALEKAEEVRAATLLLVGGQDSETLIAHRQTYDHLANAKERELVVIENTSSLFQEPEAMDRASAVVRDWLEEHL